MLINVGCSSFQKYLQFNRRLSETWYYNSRNESCWELMVEGFRFPGRGWIWTRVRSLGSILVTSSWGWFSWCCTEHLSSLLWARELFTIHTFVHLFIYFIIKCLLNAYMCWAPRICHWRKHRRCLHELVLSRRHWRTTATMSTYIASRWGDLFSTNEAK